MTHALARNEPKSAVQLFCRVASMAVARGRQLDREVREARKHENLGVPATAVEIATLLIDRFALSKVHSRLGGVVANSGIVGCALFRSPHGDDDMQLSAAGATATANGVPHRAAMRP